MGATGAAFPRGLIPGGTFRTVAVVSLLAATATFAFAGENSATYDRVELSFTASDEVANDILVAIMFYQRDGESPARLAEDVNRTLQWAVESALKTPEVEVQTLQYHSNPVYRNQKLQGWRVRQALRLESKNAKRLSELVGELQDKLSVQSVDYLLSAAARLVVEERLIAEALAGFRKRAALVTRELGRRDFRIVNLRVDTRRNGPQPLPMARSAMLATEQAPPALEAGVQTVQVDVHGTVELKLD